MWNIADSFKIDVVREDNFSETRGLQNVYTPIADLEKATGFNFMSAITSSVTNIGILFNFEFIDYILKNIGKNYFNNIKITFFYDSQADFAMAKLFENMYNYININYISIEEFAKNKDIKYLEKVMANKKFDIVFSNPPYGDKNDTSLDCKIVDAIMSITNDAIIVQPTGWISADSNYGKAKKWAEKLGKYIKKVIFVDLNKLMNIKLKTVGAIVYYTKNKFDNIIVKDTINNENYETDSLANITKYGKMWLNGVKQFKDYIEKTYIDFMPQHATTTATTDFSIRFSRWCGNVGKPDFYSPINITGVEKQFVENSYVAEFVKGHYKYNVISLNSNNERLNFVNYWKCKITRFILSFYKNNIALLECNAWRAVPWLDFTQEWNDAKLCKEFGISAELWNYIDNFIPDYYDDYKSGF